MAETTDGTTDLFDAMYTQRAIRRWLPDRVPEELLWRVVEAATRAPNGTNRQPWGFIVVTDDARRGAIAAALRARYEASERLRAYLHGQEETSDADTARMTRGAIRLIQGLDQAPVFIIPCLRKDIIGDTERLLAGSSIYGAVQNLQLAARALGLGTVMTVFSSLIEPQLREILAIPEHVQPACLIPLGYPATAFGPVKRKPVEEVTHWEGWGGVRER